MASDDEARVNIEHENNDKTTWLAMPAGGTAVMSRSLRAAAVPIDALFLDFDGTLCDDNSFSEALLARCQTICECDCTATGGPGSLSGLVGNLPIDNITTVFGGVARLHRLRAFISGLTAARVRVRVLSTSWYPVGAAAWASYLERVAVLAELPFEPASEEGEAIIALVDPGPGLSANKGAAIAERLDAWGLARRQALFVDDSAGNIESAGPYCDTVWLPQRQGIPESVLDYIEARALGCCSWAAGAGSSAAVAAEMGLAVLILAAVAALCFFAGRRRAQTEMRSELEGQRNEEEGAGLLAE